MKNITKRNLTFLLIFAIGMGFLEAIIVIYLRHIYYPNGFRFPLEIISEDLFLAEIIREICTIVMLLAVSFIAARNKLQILAYFFFTFAVWDIFYYIALKLFLNWPPSILTWDVLFLVPITWLGPVIAPVVCSITMIIFSMVVLYRGDKNIEFKVKRLEWMTLLTGFLLVFITFIWDYSTLIISNNLTASLFTFKQPQFLETIILSHIPVNYNWILFFAGIAFMYIPIFLILRESFQTKG